MDSLYAFQRKRFQVMGVFIRLRNVTIVVTWSHTRNRMQTPKIKFVNVFVTLVTQ
jgi:hypothetical protein